MLISWMLPSVLNCPFGSLQCQSRSVSCAAHEIPSFWSHSERHTNESIQMPRIIKSLGPTICARTRGLSRNSVEFWCRIWLERIRISEARAHIQLCFVHIFLLFCPLLRISRLINSVQLGSTDIIVKLDIFSELSIFQCRLKFVSCVMFQFFFFFFFGCIFFQRWILMIFVIKRCV